jgi:CBS domain containing-hemolysin-like protein
MTMERRQGGGMIDRMRRAFLRLLGRHVTEEDIQTLIQEGEHEGVIDHAEHQMIEGVLELGDTRVREIMVPRTAIRALSGETPLPEVLAFAVAEEHSRIPVYGEDLDHVTGILYTKDLLRHWGKPPDAVRLADLVRPAFFIPEAKPARDLLTEFKLRRVHMAIVVDEFGGTAGLVTIEDVLEEIVGEIRDEYDTDEPLPLTRLPDGSILFDARAHVEEVEETMGIALPRGGYDTLGGFLAKALGRVPQKGEEARVRGALFTVADADARRALRVRAERLADGD